MGQQAKAKRRQRELLHEQEARMAVLAEKSSTPEMQAWAGSFHDEECARLKDGDLPEQEQRLTRAGWRQREPNLDGLGTWDRRRLRIIHSIAREGDGQVWAHVSVSNPANTMPGWYEVRNAGWLLYPGRFGIIVVAPEDRHVNLANVAHIWYCLTAPGSPDFSHGRGTL